MPILCESERNAHDRLLFTLDTFLLPKGSEPFLKSGKSSMWAETTAICNSGMNGFTLGCLSDKKMKELSRCCQRGRSIWTDGFAAPIIQKHTGSIPPRELQVESVCSAIVRPHNG